MTACNSSTKKQPADKSVSAIDSIIPAMDSTTGAVVYDSKEDSIRTARELDSFYSIPPIRKFVWTGDVDAYDQLFALVIDTMGVTKVKEKFIDEEKFDYGKDSLPVNRRLFFTSNSYKIKVIIDDMDDTRRIFINGRELRSGKDLDTTLVGDWWRSAFEIASDQIYTMKFGRKTYLLITGYVHMCNGKGCGIEYYLLYDPSKHKGMLLQQFRSDFIAGYDSKTQSPVFIDIENEGFSNSFYAYLLAGKCYRFDASGRVRKYTDAKGKQYYYSGYRSGNDDTLSVLEGHFPDNN